MSSYIYKGLRIWCVTLYTLYKSLLLLLIVNSYSCKDEDHLNIQKCRTVVVGRKILGLDKVKYLLIRSVVSIQCFVTVN